jgi:NADH dehydrogenase FAD-containing subunit
MPAHKNPMRVVVIGGGYVGTFVANRLRMHAGGRRLERPVSAQVVANP